MCDEVGGGGVEIQTLVPKLWSFSVHFTVISAIDQFLDATLLSNYSLWFLFAYLIPFIHLHCPFRTLNNLSISFFSIIFSHNSPLQTLCS